MGSVTITNRVCKAVENTYAGSSAYGNKMRWHKTNFNMPVPQLWGTTWQEGGVLTYYGTSTSWDLTGFVGGLEICAFFSFFRFEGPYTGYVSVKQEWHHPSTGLIFANGPVSIYINLPDASYWYEHELGLNTGVAPWEVNTAGTYVIKGIATGISGQTDTNVTMSNVPDSTQYLTRSGAIWANSGDLKHYVADGWEHSITGSSGGSVGAEYAGALWVGSDNWIYWIDESGYKRKTLWKLEQFASTWSNGPTNSVSGKDAGCIYMDDEFGEAHISYIGYDGKKYLTGMGEDPTVMP